MNKFSILLSLCLLANSVSFCGEEQPYDLYSDSRNHCALLKDEESSILDNYLIEITDEGNKVGQLYKMDKAIDLEDEDFRPISIIDKITIKWDDDNKIINTGGLMVSEILGKYVSNEYLTSKFQFLNERLGNTEKQIVIGANEILIKNHDLSSQIREQVNLTRILYEEILRVKEIQTIQGLQIGTLFEKISLMHQKIEDLHKTLIITCNRTTRPQ